MSTHRPFVVTRELVRAAASCLKNEPGARETLSGALSHAAAAGVGEHFLLPGLAILWRAAEREHLQHELPSSLPGGLRDLLGRREHLAHRNRCLLAALAERARGSEEPVLLGDAAALPLLYGDLGAFSPQLWIAGMPGGKGGAETALDRHLRGTAGELAAVQLERRGCFAGSTWSTTEVAPGWRLPSRAAYLALCTARLGDPLAHPEPPVWFHVALAAKAWGAEVPLDEVLSAGHQLGLIEHLERGIAILRRLFPGIADWLGTYRSTLPLLERTVAVPVAAYKLVFTTTEPALEAASLDLLIA